MNQATLDFIRTHENDDIFAVSLASRNSDKVDYQLAIRQISGRKKVKLKVPVFYNCPYILYPVQLSLEQSSSESTALYKAAHCKGETFVDLTGGFGVDCSFIARNFSHAVYVERNNELCTLASHNFEALGLKQIQVINSDAEAYLKTMSPVDVLFIDPARRSNTGKKVFRLSDCEPDIGQIYQLLKAKAQRVLIKLSPMLDLSQLMAELKTINEIHIISVDNECKEILLLVDSTLSNDTLIHTINITGEEQQVFSFKSYDESQSTALLATEIGSYLYEPNASILKAGAFKTIGNQYNLKKLHTNTHLYTSDALLPHFPGRIFKVDAVSGTSKADIKTLKNTVPKANVSVRNYPQSVEAFRQKTGIREGGNVYLFACKTADERLAVIQCSRVKKKE